MHEEGDRQQVDQRKLNPVGIVLKAMNESPAARVLQWITADGYSALSLATLLGLEPVQRLKARENAA